MRHQKDVEKEKAWFEKDGRLEADKDLRARLRRLKFLHHRRKFTEPAAQYDSQPPSPRSPQHAVHAPESSEPRDFDSDHVVYSSSGGLFRSPRSPGPASAGGTRELADAERHAGPAAQHAAACRNDARPVAVLQVMRKVFDELEVNALRCVKKRLQEQLERVSRVHGQGEDRLEGNEKVLCEQRCCLLIRLVLALRWYHRS
jgi:hypothetical protein